MNNSFNINHFSSHSFHSFTRQREMPKFYIILFRIRHLKIRSVIANSFIIGFKAHPDFFSFILFLYKRERGIKACYLYFTIMLGKYKRKVELMCLKYLCRRGIGLWPSIFDHKCFRNKFRQQQMNMYSLTSRTKTIRNQFRHYKRHRQLIFN